MENRANTDEICLQVFAKALAATTHEIKNTLSIINENAGLLEDLVSLAEEDSGVPSGHIQSAVSTIMKQVVRSNMIMKNLNTFAHSADTPFAQVNLEQTLLLMVALTARQAAMKKTAVSAACPPDLRLHTHLFSFESLVYLTLCRIYGVVASESTLQLEAVENNSMITISFSVHDQSSSLLDTVSDDESSLAEKIGAVLAGEKDTFIIKLPASAAKK